MKSKISFINRTMLQKNVKLYWPIWTLYTIVLLLNGPVSMWSRFKNAEFIYEQIKEGIRRMIVMNVIKQDEKLPSVRVLACKYAIDRKSVV